MMDATPALFERLIGIAANQMAGQEPVAVLVSSHTPDAGGWDLPFRWQTREVDTPAELPGMVNRLLAETPVLLVPPWVEPTGRTPSPMAEAVLSCRPTKPGMLLIALVPTSVLSTARHRTLREGLAAQWSLALLLSGKGVIPGIHRQIEVTAVVLSSEPSASPTRFFRLPAHPSPDDVEADFRRLLMQDGGRVRYGYVLRERVLPGESLAFARYDPDLLARKEDLAGYGETVALGDLFTVNPGRFFTPRDESVPSGEQDPDAVRIISGRDITRDGLIAAADEDSRWANVPPESHLRSGDIVLRALQPPTDSGGLIAAEVTEADLPLTATHTVLVLRAKVPFDGPGWLVALQFLRTPLAKSLVFASSGPTVHVLRHALTELPMPQPDEAMRAAIKDLVEARTRFATWHAEANTLLNSVFTGPNSETSRTRLVRTGRNVRLRSDAAAELDDIRHTFRTRFPYPIAHHWRRLEAAHSASLHREAYTGVLDTAEILSAYIALIGLALAHETDVDLNSHTQLRQALSHNGPTFGTWITTLHEICGTGQKRNILKATPLHDLRSLLANQEARQALDTLARRRNNDAHQRRITAPELPHAFAQALTELTTLMASALFLTDLRLVQITSTAWDRFRRTNTIHYREFMGDHHVVPTHAVEYPSFELEKDSLYIIDGQQRLHPLRPYLIGLNCPHCHQWSTFHADRVANGTAVFKSLEHGHTFEQADAIGSLEQSRLI